MDQDGVPYKPGYGPIPNPSEEANGQCDDNNDQPEPYTPPVFPPFVPDVYTPEDAAQFQAQWDQHWENFRAEQKAKRNACLIDVGGSIVKWWLAEQVADRVLEKAGKHKTAHAVKFLGKRLFYVKLGMAAGCVVQYR